MQFLDVKTDFAFKKVFGSSHSKNILISFLNALLDVGNYPIVDLTIVDPYQIPLIEGMKDTFVDVKAVLANGNQVIIEMQVLSVEMEKRVLYNAAKAYSSQLQRGQPYTLLKPVIALTITDFIMFPEMELVPLVITYFKLLETRRFTEYNNDIELVFVELPKFKKTETELTTLTDKWIYFVKHAGTLELIPASLAVEPTITQAFSIANEASLTREELETQDRKLRWIADQRLFQEQAELAQQEAQQAQQEAQQAQQEAQQAQQEIQRAQQEIQRAQQEIQRAQQEAQQAQQEAQQAQQEVQQAQQEAQQAQQEAQQAQQEAQQAQQEAQQAQQEVQQVKREAQQATQQAAQQAAQETARQIAQQLFQAGANLVFIQQVTGLGLADLEGLSTAP